jgi:alkylhydroperoxidase family enzyme
MISEEHFRELAAHLDESRIVELCVLAGQYAGLAGTLNSLGVQLEGAFHAS